MAQCDAAGVNGSNHIHLHGAPLSVDDAEWMFGKFRNRLDLVLTEVSSWMSGQCRFKVCLESHRWGKPTQVSRQKRAIWLCLALRQSVPRGNHSISLDRPSQVFCPPAEENAELSPAGLSDCPEMPGPSSYFLCAR